jgi:TusA-related sulfurtransferase
MLHQALASDADSPLDVLVDNEASVENVSRAARKKGFAVEAKSEADGATRLELRK